jgi:alkylation response protein AidB-like acyl-CoA dehydrogenase
MKMQLEAARLLVYRAAWELEQGKPNPMASAVAKLYVSEALVKTALETMQILGGYGYMTEFEIERAVRDALAARIYSGTSDIQRNMIASWLGV